MGVDRQTWHQYAANLEANLQSLLDRAKSGTYWAPPVRRAYIPKPGSPGETRPILEKSMRLFSKEVMPRFKHIQPPATPFSIDLGTAQAHAA